MELELDFHKAAIQQFYHEPTVQNETIFIFDK